MPKWLRRKGPLGDEEPDLESSEFAQLREVMLISIQPEISDGEPLSIVRRVSGYLRAGSAVETAGDFSRLAALAMDAEHSPLLQPITLRLVESVVGLSRIVLKGVCARQLTHDSMG